MSEIGAMSAVTEGVVLEKLHECYDPEIPVNIVDLGLIYEINLDQEKERVDVKMTLTALGCPMAAEVMTGAVLAETPRKSLTTGVRALELASSIISSGAESLASLA